MRILITGFDPFGGEPVNPAWEAVKEVKAPQGVELIKLMVPTIHGKSSQTVIQKAEEVQPDAILCIGQAAGRAAVTPERVAINVLDARIPDNEGNQPKDVPILPEGPAAYFSTLPIRRMTEAMTAAGIKAEISNTAGTFVCNDLMYGVLNYLEKKGGSCIGGFMHVPCMPEQLPRMPEGTPAMEKETIVRALETVLQVIAE